MEIVPEAPGGKLISTSRWGEEWKEGGISFSHFSEGNKKGGNWFFYSIFSGVKKDAGRYENTHFCTKDDTFKPVNIETLFVKRVC